MSNNWPWVCGALPCLLHYLARLDRIQLFFFRWTSFHLYGLWSSLELVCFVSVLCSTASSSSTFSTQRCNSVRHAVHEPTTLLAQSSTSWQLAVAHSEPGYCTKNLVSLFGDVQSTKIKSKVIKWCFRRGEKNERREREGKKREKRRREDRTWRDNDSHEIAAAFEKRWDLPSSATHGTEIAWTCETTWACERPAVLLFRWVSLQVLIPAAHHNCPWTGCDGSVHAHSRHHAFAEGEKKFKKKKVEQFPALLVCLCGDHEGGDVPPTGAPSGLLPKVKCSSSQS